MLGKFIFAIVLTLQLNAQTLLQSTYYVNSDEIYASDIVEDVINDKLIYKIEPNRHTKRVKSKELAKILKEHGYKNIIIKSNYVKFIKKSPIDSSKIVLYIKEYYQNEYEQIDIKNIRVEPRSYMTSMPTEYSVNLKKKNYLSKSGVVSIKTLKNKKIFFNYDIVANVWIYLSRKQINKDVELSAINTIKKSIILDKFMAKPIQKLNAHALQAKRRIKKEKIITTRDVSALSLVKKNSYINVNLNSKNMSISFSAKALQNGKLGDIIRVQKTDGKRLKVKVTGKNRAEMK